MLEPAGAQRIASEHAFGDLVAPRQHIEGRYVAGLGASHVHGVACMAKEGFERGEAVGGVVDATDGGNLGPVSVLCALDHEQVTPGWKERFSNVVLFE